MKTHPPILTSPRDLLRFQSAFTRNPKKREEQEATREAQLQNVQTSRNGFALVVTLLLMILLTVIAVGLLTLSSISLRASSQGAALATARSNARLAMMLALGELQKLAGSDTRITARADILDQNNPPLLGIWKSWEGSDHDLQGRPISPGNYKSDKELRFLAWLVSGESQLIPVPNT